MARLGAPDQQEMADEGYEFDYVMVFKVWGDDEVLQPYQQTHSIRDVVHRLHKGGLQTFLHFSSSKDEVFCNIRCPLSRMHAEAERVGFRLPTDPAALEQAARRGVRDAPAAGSKAAAGTGAGGDAGVDGGSWLVHPIEVEADAAFSELSPFQHIYGRYRRVPQVQGLSLLR